MRVTIVYNPTAGPSHYEARDLVALLRLAGHETRIATKHSRSIVGAIRARPDVLIAAGGDGTVASVARALYKVGAPVPLAILPLGTSNNIARSLGIGDDVPGMLCALGRARTTHFDVGVVRAHGRAEHFVEGAGFGFIGVMLQRGTTLRGQLARELGELAGRVGAGYRHGVARLIQGARPTAARVIADGVDLSGEYLAVEVMNIRRIGPRIVLAPGSRTDDGRLDLVLVREGDRRAMADYVASESAGKLPGIVRRVRDVEMTWPARGAHVDDEPWTRKKEASSGIAHIGIAGGIKVLRW